MLNSEFTHWLYGYCKLESNSKLTPKQLWIIKNHLNLVYAVEGHLDEPNAWLEHIILDLTIGNIIQEPSKDICNEIFNRYLSLYDH